MGGSGPISTSSGAGGIMNSMKAALHVGGRHSHQHQPAAAQASGSGATSKVRDGSAHPHAGSDAQVNISAHLTQCRQPYWG